MPAQSKLPIAKEERSIAKVLPKPTTPSDLHKKLKCTCLACLRSGKILKQSCRQSQSLQSNIIPCRIPKASKVSNHQSCHFIKLHLMHLGIVRFLRACFVGALSHLHYVAKCLARRHQSLGLLLLVIAARKLSNR